MCGIIGYTGFRAAHTVLLEGLKRLEYRGYDSAGISLLNTTIETYKTVGLVEELKKIVPSDNDAVVGIGHTRWATHGGVTKENAHPHNCCHNDFSIIHNGIIENHDQLREKLISKGHCFKSQTDSEIVAHLLEEHYNGDLLKAFRETLSEIKGSYALLIIHKDHPDKILGARRESPLLIGVGDNENFLASDTTAFLDLTKKVVYLDDGEHCLLSPTTVEIYDEHNKSVQKKIHTITWSVDAAQKGGYEHYMLKEIFEQPESITQTLKGRIFTLEGELSFPKQVETLLGSKFSSITIVACGTSYYAASISRYFLEEFSGLPTTIEIASEYRYFGIKRPDNLTIFISQSGETLDTLAAIKKAKNNQSKTLVITNVQGSTATRAADCYLLTQCGPEIGVAATKTFTSQLLVLYLIALRLGREKNIVGKDELRNLLSGLRRLPSDLQAVLDTKDEIRHAAQNLTKSHDVFFIGRGVNYPLALEGALKLKEISYNHAEGYAAGEIKHGPFALLTKETPVVAIVSMDQTHEKLLSNIGEIKARGSPILAIASSDDGLIESYADIILRYPETQHPCFSISVILQLLAYYTALERGCNIDKPRNLAKSVTVE